MDLQEGDVMAIAIILTMIQGTIVTKGVNGNAAVDVDMDLHLELRGMRMTTDVDQTLGGTLVLSVRVMDTVMMTVPCLMEVYRCLRMTICPVLQGRVATKMIVPSPDMVMRGLVIEIILMPDTPTNTSATFGWKMMTGLMRPGQVATQGSITR